MSEHGCQIRRTIPQSKLDFKSNFIKSVASLTKIVSALLEYSISQSLNCHFKYIYIHMIYTKF